MVALNVLSLDNQIKTKITKALIIFISAFSFVNSYAQIWELGGGIGTANYNGDIIKYYQPLSTRPSGTIIIKRNFSPSFLLKFTGSYAFIAANDKYKSNQFSQSRNYNLNSSIWEIGFTPEYNFLDFRKKSYRQTQKWSPFFYGGIALWSYQSKLKSNGIEINPEDLPQNGVGISIPMGIGIKYSINHFWNVGFEVGSRKTYTDALDLTSNISKTNFQVGDNTKNDWYFISTFFITYTFWGVRCPESLKDLQ